MIFRGLRNHASALVVTCIMLHQMSTLPQPQCHMQTAITALRISGANLIMVNIQLFKKSPPCSQFRVSTLKLVSRSAAPDTQSRPFKLKSLMKAESIFPIHDYFHDKLDFWGTFQPANGGFPVLLLSLFIKHLFGNGLNGYRNIVYLNG